MRDSKYLRAFFLLWLYLYVGLHSTNMQAKDSEKPAEVTCLGPRQAKSQLIYLHGFEQGSSWSSEETHNRKVLEDLAQQRQLAIAIPVSPYLCKNKQRCWVSKTNSETLSTFEFIWKASLQCWKELEAYSLLGFSNGGYFAFKLYKIHKDPKLKQIIGVGSSGTWNPQIDSLSPYSSFHLIIGQKELTLNSARQFERQFQKSQKDFRISLTPGGHKLDLDSLLELFPPPA